MRNEMTGNTNSKQGKTSLVITEKNDVVYYGYFSDGNPIELYCEKKQSESLLGNIYAARVERVAEGIHGAFLEIANGEKCYYSTAKKTQPVKISPGHEDRLYGGDIILVQIVKDAVKTKLPVADGNISLTGKYFVLTLSDKRSSVSKKIKDKEERARLSSLLAPFLSEDYGIVIRTNAAGMDTAVLEKELRILTGRYQELMRKAKFSPGKTLLYRDPPHYITFAQDLPKDKMDEIITDRQDIHEELRSFFHSHGDEENEAKTCLYKDDYSLFQLYRLEHHFEKAREKLVWLKSGGSIVIEQTEAMVVVDVNTGCVTKNRKQADDLFFRMNCEAVEEIARQLRLRNLSGIIIIDFINMKNKKHQEELLYLLQEECAKDRVATRVIDMTGLHLVEMTRSKVRRPLHEQWKVAHGRDKTNCSEILK